MPDLYESCGFLGFSKKKAENAGVCEPGSTSLVDGSCVAVAKPCGPGLDWKDGKCVLDAEEMERLCGSLSIKDGKCEMDLGGQLCGPGLDFEDGKCIANSNHWVPNEEVHAELNKLEEKYKEEREEMFNYRRGIGVTVLDPEK